MGRFLLPIQRLLQNQLRQHAPFAASMHIQDEVFVGSQPVGPQRVGANIRIVGAFQGESGSRSRRFGDVQPHLALGETGIIVIDIQNLYLSLIQLQWVLYHHFQVEETGGIQSAELLSVYLLIDKQYSIFQVDIQVVLTSAGHNAEPAGGQFRYVQAEIVGDIAHKCAVFQFLANRVANLPKRRTPKPGRTQEQKRQTTVQNPAWIRISHNTTQVIITPLLRIIIL
uniref:Uncharacterized protein n=1 Tax=Callorhinchus milii TaxID=7868 RepID=A0A4W3K9I9_CALMI